MKGLRFQFQEWICKKLCFIKNEIWLKHSGIQYKWLWVWLMIRFHSSHYHRTTAPIHAAFGCHCHAVFCFLRKMWKNSMLKRGVPRQHGPSDSSLSGFKETRRCPCQSQEDTPHYSSWIKTLLGINIKNMLHHQSFWHVAPSQLK